ncbi:alpha/beta-hydrolase [Marasmius fiardii PR-910]|nr:alpha/beta-hydrolase [Marasmius fiardii PR-910]
MDPSSYKDIETSRGLNYHYYFSPATSGKLTLVFLHGFPSTSFDWRFQVAFFKQKGYGLIVPDMLGYGGTAKPTATVEYKPSLITKDVIDILDTEKIDKAVIIGHDWGSRITSHNASRIFPDKGRSCQQLFNWNAPGRSPTTALLSTWPKRNEKLRGGIKTLSVHVPFESQPNTMKTTLNMFGFGLLFSNSDRVRSSTVSTTSTSTKSTSISTGNRRISSPTPSLLTPLDKRIQSEALLKGGLAAPMCWYKTMLSGIAPEDDKGIPIERYKTDKPVFFGAAQEDYVCIADFHIHTTKTACKNLTVKKFQANHWVQLQRADEVNEELEDWLVGRVICT